MLLLLLAVDKSIFSHAEARIVSKLCIDACKYQINDKFGVTIDMSPLFRPTFEI